jgi:hypothetical protein
VRKLMQLIKVRLFGAAAVTPVAAGTTRVLRGLREGDQPTLLGGAAILAYGLLKKRGPERELIARREVPIGSAVVIRHGKKGQLPTIEIYETGE